MFKKTSILNAFFFFFLISAVSAQESPKESPKDSVRGAYTIYVNTPIFMLFWQDRIKIEHRFSESQYLALSLNWYHMLNPGAQAYLEYRKCFSEKKTPELFYFVKLGAGESFSYGGTYGLMGAGIGEQFYFGKHFSIQLSEGMKYCPALGGDVEAPSGFGGLFYITGPGAVLDVNVNLGWTF